jgi:hypothetical protein
MQPSNVYYGGGAQPEVNQSRPSSRRKLLFIILGVLLAVTVILAMVSALTGTNTAKLGNNMISQIALGDSDAAYALLSDDSRQVTSSEEWLAFVTTNKPLLENKKVEKVFSKDLGNGIVSEGYNVGEPGSIQRVTINYSSDTSKVESVKVNATNL